jgi:hypothetical protein
LSALSDDAEAAATSAGEFDLSGLRTICSDMQSDAASGQAYDEVPDAQMQDAWSKALTQYANAAADCIAGVDESDGTLIERSTDELSSGSDYAGQASAREVELAGG